MQLVDLRRFIPFVNPAVSSWAIEARLLRWLTLLWLFVGLVVLFSASYPVGNAYFDDGLYYLKRQTIGVVVGLVAFNLVVHFPLRHILGITHWCVLLFLGLICITLVPGVGTSNLGAARWLAVGSFQIQPSELIKPFLVLQSARLFGQWNSLKWRVRLIWLGIFLTVLIGILKQPNLSTAALCGMSIWLVALAAGIPYLYLNGAALGGILMGVYSITKQEYQRRRVLSFLNPWADPMHNGYQLIQSLLAVGSGGIWGTGFGLSQQKLFYLPIQYTDFIFAVFAEEFGFIGCVLLLLLLVVYATLALMVAIKTRNAVNRLVAIGAMTFMIGQSLLNIAVATGALPTTGLPFPLISYGSNSMIASLLIAGLLIRVARESSEAEVVPIQKRRTVARL
ncbi:MAG: FtsW/RodA/SpoVE family cell cycle protein [Chroococcidiopsidaceae cyanobacterium CP_BM_ER_R8_30]|nr:FtsW/RodA/SpoVE family cell cycle protein [Chroococcidiopsidaceae cyanobacterium CP_BM_ER_R8_30]